MMNTYECSEWELVGPQFLDVLVYVIRWTREGGWERRKLEVRSYPTVEDAFAALDPFHQEPTCPE